MRAVYSAEGKINKRWFEDEELKEENHLELCLLYNCLDGQWKNFLGKKLLSRFYFLGPNPI